MYGEVEKCVYVTVGFTEAQNQLLNAMGTGRRHETSRSRHAAGVAEHKTIDTSGPRRNMKLVNVLTTGTASIDIGKCSREDAHAPNLHLPGAFGWRVGLQQASAEVPNNTVVTSHVWQYKELPNRLSWLACNRAGYILETTAGLSQAKKTSSPKKTLSLPFLIRFATQSTGGSSNKGLA